ncbi:MAG: hypothetical protein MJZ28_05150 [Paludibacteraceae bacterium]|nr:hypothetical protein [Paludibacteraceae bacterium]
MAQLAIINYEVASIDIINLSEAIEREYADDYDRLVYGKMGYKTSSVYYMIAENISVRQIEEYAIKNAQEHPYGKKL